MQFNAKRNRYNSEVARCWYPETIDDFTMSRKVQAKTTMSTLQSRSSQVEANTTIVVTLPSQMNKYHNATRNMAKIPRPCNNLPYSSSYQTFSMSELARSQGCILSYSILPEPNNRFLLFTNTARRSNRSL